MEGALLSRCANVGGVRGAATNHFFSQIFILMPMLIDLDLAIWITTMPYIQHEKNFLIANYFTLSFMGGSNAMFIILMEFVSTASLRIQRNESFDKLLILDRIKNNFVNPLYLPLLSVLY